MLTLDPSQMHLEGFRPEYQYKSTLSPIQQEAHEQMGLNYTTDLKPAFMARLSTKYSLLSSDLRQSTSVMPRHDQRKTGSCVLNSLTRGCEIKRVQKFGPASHIALSRLDGYYLAREAMYPPETNVDEGTLLSIAAECFSKFGVCAEKDWPFDESNLFTSPPWGVMRTGYVHKIRAWFKLNSSGTDLVEDIIANCAVDNPVQQGLPIGKQWMEYDAALGPLKPATDVLGRHATLIVGWDPNKFGGCFIFENSWGEEWGDGGYGYMSPDVVIQDLDSRDGNAIVVAAGYEDWVPTEST